MDKKTERLPLDTQLLSNAIIELNIARHVISLYPSSHGLVEKALDRAFDILAELFELRNRITLAVAKNTLIVDEHFLDKKNPVYREFALSLSRKNIACLTFIKGVTRDEVYAFHRFLTQGPEGLSAETLPEAIKEYDLVHILVEPLDYRRFSFQEGKAEKAEDRFLLERYIKGLLDGTLVAGDMAEVVEGVPPEVLAGLLNDAGEGMVKEAAYDTVISSYLRGSSRRLFSSKELGKLLVFINGLRPELKKQFLTSSVKAFGNDMKTLNQSLAGVSIDNVIELLGSMNEHDIVVPEPIRNLLHKFAQISPEGFKRLEGGRGNLTDDIVLSPEILNLLQENKPGKTTPDEYKAEIQKLIAADLSGPGKHGGAAFVPELEEDAIRYYFGKTLLEVVSLEMPDFISTADCQDYIRLVTGMAEHAADTGQYGHLHELLMQLEANRDGNRYPEIAGSVLERCQAEDFVLRLVSSFRSHGRRSRVTTMLMCDYYGEKIVPFLFDVLGKEQNMAVRRFLITLLVRLGDKVFKESLKRLADRRWYVRRNILYVLSEVGVGPTAGSIKPFCRDSDPRVCLEAAKCLVRSGEETGVNTLRDMMRSEQKGVAEDAITMSGSLKVKELLPDLVEMLKGKAVRASDFQQKILIVRALGQLDDPRAEQPLRRILDTRSLFSKERLDALKKEARRALSALSSKEGPARGEEPADPQSRADR